MRNEIPFVEKALSIDYCNENQGIVTFKHCPDCVNYESNYSSNNTLADRQAFIALLQSSFIFFSIFVFLLVGMCADSWHFIYVHIMRIV